MTRKWFLGLGLATTTALGGALAVPALAQGPGGDRGHEGRGMSGPGAMGGHGAMMEMMQRMHGRDMGMMDGGMMDGMGPMRGMMRAFDADGDGSLTPDEFRTGLEGRLSEFDADGDGSLSIDEFEALHSAMVREQMVDRFQHLDNDGDGAVTSEEITAPADQMERMQQMRQRMMDTAPGQRSGQGAGMMQDMNPGGGMTDDGPTDPGTMQGGPSGQ